MKHLYEEGYDVEFNEPASKKVARTFFLIAVGVIAALVLGIVLADRAMGQSAPTVKILNVTDTETGITYYYNRVGTSVMVSQERSYVPYPQVQNYEGRDYFPRYVPDYSDPTLRGRQWVLVPVGQYPQEWQAQGTTVRGTDRWGSVRSDQGGAYLPWVSTTREQGITPLRISEPTIMNWLDE